MKVLLATDGSDTSRAVVDFMMRFPVAKESEITVLNVIRDTFLKYEEWEVFEGIDEEHRAELDETERLVRQEREEIVSAEAERLRSAGWTCETEVRTGQPASEIISAAGTVGVDLVVLGSVGRSGLREFHLGRVSNSVIEYSPVSVLVVKPPAVESAIPAGSKQTSFRVLVAFDGSQSSKKAVEFCQSLPLDEQSEVLVLGVLRLMHGFRQDIQQRLSKVWHQKKSAAKAALDEVVKGGNWPTPHVAAELRESSSVTEAILDAAKTTNSDMIILGHKGKGAVETFLLGSGARRITRHAPCSVLVVR